ncbi:MAG TPA: ATP-binding protein [Planctomycetota bacterium]|nr:ATP-binding protein [Planctomycetota bacterium]
MGEVRGNLTGDLALRERVKELTCLYGIAQVTTNQSLSLEEVLQDIVMLLPSAWLYPEVAKARIVFDEHSYVVPDFTNGKQSISSDIIISGKKRGSVDVSYTVEKPVLDEGPFLKEERNLIDTVAREVSVIIEKQQVDKEKIRLQEQMRHSDRLATVGQLAAGVAHELNEPLSNMLGFAQLAKKSQGLPKSTEHDIDKIINASLHAREIVKKLLLFSRQMPARKNKVNLNQIVQDGLYFLKSRCEKEGIELIRILAPNLPEIYADSGQLHQVLVNLVVNAIQAMPAGGKLTIKTFVLPDYISFVVEDTGVGMNDEIIKKMFIPFFTTKEVGQGTGLGLSLVHGIVTSHGGTIRVQSKLGHGSQFEIKLPVNAQIEPVGDE